MFKFMVDYAVLYGEAYAPDPDITGVSCWLPSVTATMTLWRTIRTGGLWSLHMSRESLHRIMATDQYLTQMRLRIMKKEHLYLTVIAVQPEHQAKGLGGMMLRHVLRRADTDAIPCYLETFGQNHVDLYTHFGFAVAESVTIPGMQEPVFPMSRLPQATNSSIN